MLLQVAVMAMVTEVGRRIARPIRQIRRQVIKCRHQRQRQQINRRQSLLRLARHLQKRSTQPLRIDTTNLTFIGYITSKTKVRILFV